jgi:hypothetical protein
MTDTIRNTQKRFGSLAMMTAIIIGLFLVFVGQKTLAKGLVLGALFSVVNFVLIGEILPLTIGQSRKKSSVTAFFSIVLRYGLLAVPLIAAMKWDQFNFVSTAVGLFMVQIVIFSGYLSKNLTWIHFNTHRKNVNNG